MIEIVLTVGAVALLTGGIAYVAYVQEKKRTQEMAALAAGMGWGFEAEPGLPPGLAGVEPFGHGHSHRVRNRITRSRGDTQVAVFDFFYTTGRGKSRKNHRNTVTHLPLPVVTPVFSVRAEHFGHRIAGVFGMQDIDFPEYPAFSQRYLLRGTDEPAIRRAFNPAVVEFFEAHTRLGASCSGRDLFVWLDGLAPTAEIETRMEMALELRRRLVAS
jgi:hypothetical protein